MNRKKARFFLEFMFGYFNSSSKIPDTKDQDEGQYKKLKEKKVCQ